MNLLQTIKQVSELLNISTQAIYNKINNTMKKDLQGLVKDVQRGNRKTRMIEPKGVELIRKSLEDPFEQDIASDVQGIGNELAPVLNEIIEVLKLQLLAKDEQLIAKDEQIRELNNTIRNLTEMNKNTQVLLHREQESKMLEEGKPEKWYHKWWHK